MPIWILAAAACSHAGTVAPPPAETAIAEPAPAETIPEESSEEAEHALGNAYQIVGDPLADGPSLTMTVRYGGGCAEHVWQLSPGPDTDDTFVLGLVHDNGGDRCRAIKTQTLTLDLTPHREKLCSGTPASLQVLTSEGPRLVPILAETTTALCG